MVQFEIGERGVTWKFGERGVSNGSLVRVEVRCQYSEGRGGSEG